MNTVRLPRPQGHYYSGCGAIRTRWKGNHLGPPMQVIYAFSAVFPVGATSVAQGMGNGAAARVVVRLKLHLPIRRAFGNVRLKPHLQSHPASCGSTDF